MKMTSRVLLNAGTALYLLSSAGMAMTPANEQAPSNSEPARSVTVEYVDPITENEYNTARGSSSDVPASQGTVPQNQSHILYEIPLESLNDQQYLLSAGYLLSGRLRPHLPETSRAYNAVRFFERATQQPVYKSIVINHLKRMVDNGLAVDEANAAVARLNTGQSTTPNLPKASPTAPVIAPTTPTEADPYSLTLTLSEAIEGKTYPHALPAPYNTLSAVALRNKAIELFQRARINCADPNKKSSIAGYIDLIRDDLCAIASRERDKQLNAQVSASSASTSGPSSATWMTTTPVATTPTTGPSPKAPAVSSTESVLHPEQMCATALSILQGTEPRFRHLKTQADRDRVAAGLFRRSDTPDARRYLNWIKKEGRLVEPSPQPAPTPSPTSTPARASAPASASYRYEQPSQTQVNYTQRPHVHNGVPYPYPTAPTPTSQPAPTPQKPTTLPSRITPGSAEAYAYWYKSSVTPAPQPAPILGGTPLSHRSPTTKTPSPSPSSFGPHSAVSYSSTPQAEPTAQPIPVPTSSRYSQSSAPASQGSQTKPFDSPKETFQLTEITEHEAEQRLMTLRPENLNNPTYSAGFTGEQCDQIICLSNGLAFANIGKPEAKKYASYATFAKELKARLAPTTVGNQAPTKAASPAKK